MTSIPRAAALVALVAAMALGTPQASAAGGKVMTWTVDGVVRRAIVYAPASATREPAPLVLSFHGHGDTMENFEQTDIHVAWPEAIVVYFQGLPSRDGYPGWQNERGLDNDRDLRLVDTAIEGLGRTFVVDRARIYATGFSNGAVFTYLLWAERPKVFAAFAPVAARLRPSVRPTEPRPVFHVAGMLDRQMLFGEQQKTMEIAKQANGATGRGTSCGNGCTLWESGKAPVMTWVHAGGHEFPDGTEQRIAKFFRDHPLKP